MNRRSPVDWPLIGLGCLLVFAPLPLGSNRDWAVGLLGIGLVLVLLGAWWGLLRRGLSPLAYLAPAAWPLAALLGYVLLVGLQWSAGLQGWSFAGTPALLTVDPYATGHYLFRSLVYVGFFAAALLTLRDAAAVRTLALVLVGSGLFQAVLAIVLLSAKAQYQFMHEDMRHGAHAIGSFVNRNHLAGYLYLCLSVGIGLLLGGMRNEAAAVRRWRDHVVSLLKFMMTGRMALRVLLVVMVIALVLTRSRMGNTAFFVSLLGLGVVVAVTMPALRTRAAWLVASLLVVDIIVIGQWVGLERVVQRLDRTALAIEDARGEETVEARLEPARHTLPMVQARPWAGHGGGTYYTAFPEFKSRAMLLHLYYFDHAHNDYAEIAADTGLLGLGLLAVVVLTSLWRVRKLLSLRHPPQTRGMAYGALMAMSCLLLHSMVDFNLQIPANAATFIVILGLLWACPAQRGRSRAAPQADGPDLAHGPEAAAWPAR